jgi:hypothetical protein
MLGRLSIDANDHSVGRRSSHSPQLKEQAQTDVFFSVMGKLEKAYRHPDNPYQKTEAESFS